MADVAAAAATVGMTWLDVRLEAEIEAAPLPEPAEAAGVSLWGPKRRLKLWPLASVMDADEGAATEQLGSDKDSPILVFCADGVGAAKAKQVLMGLGFTNVVDSAIGDVSKMAEEAQDCLPQTWIYPRMAVEYTYPMLGGTWAILFLVVVIVGALGHGNLTEGTNYDWVIAETDASQRWDGYSDARSQTDELGTRRRAQDQEHRTRETETGRNNLLFLYETKDLTNIFTPENIQSICRVEAVLLEDPAYISSFCRLAYADDTADSATSCAQPMGSVASAFYGDGRADCPLLDTAVVSAVASQISDPAFIASTGFFLGSDVLDNSGGLAVGQTARLRSNINLGSPLEGFSDPDPRRDDPQQVEHYQPFWEDMKQKIFTHFGMEDYVLDVQPAEGNVNVYYWGGRMGASEFDDTVSSDLLYSLGSILIVLCFLVFHTGSFFLGGFGMLQILMSMPTSLFIYRTICGVDFLTQLHVLSVYLVLGIGADDLFVFFDAWRQSGYAPPAISGSLLTRLDYAYKRAAGAMFTTSFTTAVAFIATASSPVMPISAFGYFAACTVILNYVLVMSVFPCLLMVWYKTGSKNFCCCNIPGWGSQGNAEAGQDAGQDAAKQEAAEVDELAEMSVLERFYATTYTDLMTGPAKFGFVGGMLVVFVFLSYFAMQMEPPVDPEQWFPDDHMLTKLGVQNTKYIGGNEDSYVWVDIVWGVQGVDRGDDFNHWVPEERGTAVFDTSFDFSTASAQEHYLATCEKLRTESCLVQGCMDGTGKLTRPGEVHCFLEDYRAWYRVQQCSACEDDPASPFADAGYSCDALIAAGTVTCETDLATVHEASAPGLATIGDHCHRTCEICTPNADDASDDACEAAVEFPTGAEFLTSLKEFRSDPVYFQRWGEQIGVVGEQLKYVSIQFMSTLQHDKPQVTTRTMYDKLEGLVATQNLAAPAGMKSAFHCDGGVFTWMETQQGLVDNVFTGFAICFPAAFFVLLGSTLNPVTASLAIVTIVGVVGCVLGLCKFMMGWGLGVAESIAAVIVIGFSVDFTVHLAHMYSEAGHRLGLQLRSERMGSSAKTMGVTVTMGACTTLGSGMMLWMCTLTFFTKFAVLIIATICFSLSAAMLFFMPLSAICGPEGDFADLAVLYKNLTGGGGEAESKSAAAKAEEAAAEMASDQTENLVAED